ncbi:wall-associated receptor kinase 2-like [Dioscorea cayenensis subsp. rotundata]|uniref:Wall-associated receptor kinase 2-like n=1 Tax=Dioscorea cayennensis subsp. rotundata TaxID=55577 RepID=A0AB40BKX6_DIOCR|nr:wall-associated receptor kinase 2-like [Dioscorea cayenensis subsp. rotundata]
MSFCLLVHVLLVFLFCSSSTPSILALNGSLPGCPDKCGNVTIPYPFGISGCSLSTGFDITCNDTYNPPKPFTGSLGIFDITDDVVNVNFTIAGGDYCSGGTFSTWMRLGGDQYPFTFSQTRNMFTAIGCDTLAVFYDAWNTTSSISGCVSMCSNMSSIDNGTCSGNGCCQTSIPTGLKRLYVKLDTISDKIGTLNGYNFTQTITDCSKAFLVDKEWFLFQTSFLKSFNRRKVPVVLDWAIGKQKCDVAKKKYTDYACMGNTQCVDSANGLGYRCSCLPGYQGNPYLPAYRGGCQDINECDSDQKTHNCSMLCVNTPGSYYCSCPHGYDGDGKINGTGCTKKSKLLQIVLGCALGSLLFLMVGIWLSYWATRNRRMNKLREKFFEQNGGLLMQQLLSSHNRGSKSARIFTENELDLATDNYNESRILGQGAHGIVYKGILADSQIVAIKKSKFMDNNNNNEINQKDQFINEVFILSQVIHKNVVKILGCCFETPVPLLVYEYVPGGTLYHHIHKQRGSLSWSTRLKIATETADALSYLHSATEIPILHRDVKSANILLDDNCMAKVSDFGASRLIPQDTDNMTTMVQGTLGYLDPEYLHTGVLTEKSDVYSFGVLLAELLTGEQSISFKRKEEEMNLGMYFLMKMKADTLFDILEPRVKTEAKQEQLQGVAELIKRCLKIKGDERPTMKAVTLELERLKSQDEDSLHEWPLNEGGVDESLVVKTKRFYNWNRFEDESLLRGSIWSYNTSDLETGNSSDQLVGSSSTMPLSSSTTKTEIMLTSLGPKMK